MKSSFTCILLFLAFSCNAQIIELGYSPVAVRGWGNLPKTSKYNASFLWQAYKFNAISYTPGVRFTHLNSRSKLLDRFGERVDGRYNMFFLMPASFNFSLGKINLLDRVGLGVSNKSFPNNDGLRLNFLIEAGIQLPVNNFFLLSLRYSHISNGFRGQINPGLDNVVFATAFNF